MFLWIKATFLNYLQTLRICMLYFIKKIKGTSFYARQKGSLTIEAAVIIPIMVGFLACVLFFFRVLQVQATIEEALVQVGRKLAVESCMLESQESMFFAAEAHLLEALSEKEVVRQYVSYGNYGIYLGKSDFAGDDITLCAEYDVKLPVNFFEIKTLHLSSVNRFQKWTGAGLREENTEYVYVTATGRVYHQSLNCRVLDLTVSMVEESQIHKIRGLDGQKYYLCKKCQEHETSNQMVYYTNYGTRYHRDVSCSLIKRNIRKILKVEIGNRSACSFCYP